LDGAGLSTQSALLAAYLRSSGYDVLLTKEPTAAPIGKLIKAALNRNPELSLFTLQLLFAADRAEHLKQEIEPALASKKVVISDRYILSSLAFGSVDNDLEFLLAINARFRRPDITVIIDTPPAVCLERIEQNRENIELFEEEQRLEQVRARYLELKNYFEHTVIVKGDRPKDEVAKEIQTVVEHTLFHT
ncbi:MAG: dTMP kinase, partial [Methanomicrobia archaeon]|nr:dTMP kinase [Methanomicrobia archaeon]